MIKTIAFAVCFVIAQAVGAAAQDPNQPVLGGFPSGLKQGPVRVQSQVNFFVPGPTGDSDAAVNVREHARRSIYDMAAHECDLLRETIAKDCRLESVNANVTSNRQFNQMVVQQLEGWQVQGTMTFQITAK
jgi:hypothetical protein